MKNILVIAVFASFSVGVHAYSLLGTNFGAPTVNGKDNIYAPAVGDLVYDSGDSTFYGRTHNSAWVPLGGASSIVPVGTVITFAGSVCPSGYILANGSEVNREEYSDLYSVLGDSHGSGDGVSTFNLPDYRGRFLRGVDGDAGNDPDKSSRAAMSPGGNVGNSIGSVQGDEVGSHRHSTSGIYISYYGAGAGPAMEGGGGNTFWTAYSGGNETRPKNAYVNFCLKY